MTAECPTCGDTFNSKVGMRSHHTQVHGKSLVRETVSCDQCGCDFDIHEFRLNNSDRLFCSEQCNHNFQKEADNWHPPQYSGEDHPQYDSVEVNCDKCGEITEKWPYELEKSDNTFCSVDCRAAWQSENIVGEDHHQWEGGGNNTYRGGWDTAREKAIDHAGGKCEECGMSRDRHKELYSFDINVHHIVPLKEYEDHAEAHRQENLMVLCAKCHGEIEHGGSREQGQTGGQSDPSTDAPPSALVDALQEAT
jgi:endogenous inhibitor of DNA gyrase (YacG/DUF329 family)